MEPMPTGAVLRERYRVEDLVEAGQRENLYRVIDRKFYTEWAMREMDAGVLPPNTKAAALYAFTADAEKLSHLRHPGVAQVVDHFIEEDRAYLLTEWVKGKTWRAVMKDNGNGLPLARVVDLGSKLLDALYYLHTATEPRVFGCLSPLSVLVTPEDEVKLFDHGLSSHFDAKRHGSGSFVFGSLGYIAPEYTKGGELQPSMDTYAAGALLFYAASGRDAVSFGSPLPSLLTVNPDIPEDLDRVVMKAVQPDPNVRYADVGTFKHDLMAAAESFAPDATPSAGAMASTAVELFDATAPQAQAGSPAAEAPPKIDGEDNSPAPYSPPGPSPDRLAEPAAETESSPPAPAKEPPADRPLPPPPAPLPGSLVGSKRSGGCASVLLLAVLALLGMTLAFWH